MEISRTNSHHTRREQEREEEMRRRERGRGKRERKINFAEEGREGGMEQRIKECETRDEEVTKV